MVDRISVLIADDRPRSRSGLKALLSTWPEVEVVGTAKDGEEAVALAGALLPDVVLMDVRMPVLDGLEATRRIRRFDKDVGVVVLTLYGSHRNEALAAGANAFLLKGCHSEELRAAIRTARRRDPVSQRSHQEEKREGKMAKVLMIHPDKCTGCRSCELACSFQHGGAFQPTTSRVHVYTWEREGMSVPMMCQQCDPAACVSVCPTGAMHQNKAAGVVEWDGARCISCKMCTMACPFGNAAYEAATNSILKCDLCNGDPQCATACTAQAIQYITDSMATRARKKGFATKFKEAFQEVR